MDAEMMASTMPINRNFLKRCMVSNGRIQDTYLILFETRQLEVPRLVLTFIVKIKFRA